jgi:hypothetical protein
MGAGVFAGMGRRGLFDRAEAVEALLPLPPRRGSSPCHADFGPPPR